VQTTPVAMAGPKNIVRGKRRATMARVQRRRTALIPIAATTGKGRRSQAAGSQPCESILQTLPLVNHIQHEKLRPSPPLCKGETTAN